MTKLDRELFLEVSPIKVDGGQKVGKLPGSVAVNHLRVLGHPESPIRAIRSKCLDCSGGVASEVRKCVAVTCSLWPFRMGLNPFHGKKGTVMTSESKTSGVSVPPGSPIENESMRNPQSRKIAELEPTAHPGRLEVTRT
jgi:hypothetical protein